MIQGIANNLVKSNRYVVRFAQNEEEIKDAQRLRFQVFNLELGEGLSSAYDNQLDMDAYDEQCHHLLVIDKKSEQVIGTYRMQTYATASKKLGFYTGNEFDLSSIDDEIITKSTEVGRACIAKEHRNGRVLFLLWRGLAAYMKQMDTRYLFGCCSITSQDAIEAWKVMDYLYQKNHIHPDIMVSTTEEYRCPKPSNLPSNAGDDVELPQLFRLYMDIGTKVCSPPAIDREFSTIDYLILLDKDNIDERTRMLFFR